MHLYPTDYIQPDWSPPRYQYVHDWRAYISNEVREIWPTFTSHQKLLLARSAQNIADAENWD